MKYFEQMQNMLKEYSKEIEDKQNENMKLEIKIKDLEKLANDKTEEIVELKEWKR